MKKNVTKEKRWFGSERGDEYREERRERGVHSIKEWLG